MKVYLTVGVMMLCVLLMAGCGAAPNAAPPATDQAKTEAPAPEAATTPIAEAPAAPEQPKPADDQAKAAPDQPAPEATTPIAPEEPKEQVPDVVAKVGDKEISGKDYLRQVEQSTKMMRSRGMPGTMSSDDKKKLIDDMVNEEILTQLAEKSGVTATTEEAKAEIENAKAKMPSPDTFQKYLQQMNIDEPTLIEMIRQRMVKQKYIQEQTKDLKPTEEELQAEYERLKAAGNLERQTEAADVAHILVKVDGKDEAAWEEGKKKIDAARARIVGGEDFGKVAKEVSDDPGSKDRGGAYPGTPRGQMVPEFDKVMWEIPLNEVSEPFRTQYGWHILKVTARHEKGTMSLDEIRDQLTRMMEAQKKREFIQKAVDEARANMNVQVLYTPPQDPTPPAAPEAAAPGAPEAPAAPATPEAPAAPATPEAPAAPAAPAAPEAPAPAPAPEAPAAPQQQ